MENFGIPTEKFENYTTKGNKKETYSNPRWHYFYRQCQCGIAKYLILAYYKHYSAHRSLKTDTLSCCELNVTLRWYLETAFNEIFNTLEILLIPKPSFNNSEIDLLAIS